MLGGPEAAPIRRILDLLAGGAGLPRPLFGVPRGAVRGVARAVEGLWHETGRPGEAPLSPHSVDVATRDRAYSWVRAHDELGWTPAVALADGVPGGRARGWRPQVVQRPAKAAKAARTVPGFEPGHDAGAPAAGGFDWRGYFVDPDEGLGTVYERFALDKVLDAAIAATGSTSVLHAPLFGMMGIPGLDAVFLARRGMRVGLLDVDGERLEAVHNQWRDLGLDPEVHLVDGLDPRRLARRAAPPLRPRLQLRRPVVVRGPVGGAGRARPMGRQRRAHVRSQPQRVHADAGPAVAQGPVRAAERGRPRRPGRHPGRGQVGAGRRRHRPVRHPALPRHVRPPGQAPPGPQGQAGGGGRRRRRGRAGVGLVDPALPHRRRPGDGGPGGPPVTVGAIPPGS